MSDRTENLFALACFGVLVGALVALAVWHASIVDRAVDAHRTELVEAK